MTPIIYFELFSGEPINQVSIGKLLEVVFAILIINTAILLSMSKMAYKEAIGKYIENISTFAPNQKANPSLLYILGIDESHINSSNEFILNQFFSLTNTSKTSKAVKRLVQIIDKEDTPYYSEKTSNLKSNNKE